MRNPSSCILAREKHAGMARAANCWAIHIYYLFSKTALKKEYDYFMDEETELHSCLWSLSKEVAKMQTHSCSSHRTMLSSTRVTVSNITLQLQESTIITEASRASFIFNSTAVSSLTLKRRQILIAWLVRGGRATRRSLKMLLEAFALFFGFNMVPATWGHWFPFLRAISR